MHERVPLVGGGSGRQSHARGIPLLAYLLGMTPRTMHVRRFSVSSARVLLLLQHEIAVLERQLQCTKIKASGSNDEGIAKSVLDFDCMKACSFNLGPSPPFEGVGPLPRGTQHELYEKLKEKMKEFGMFW